MTAGTRLSTPPKLKRGTCRIVQLGGLEEVGRNMVTFEIDGKILIVDCGVLFPEEEQPGVDLILPDFSYLDDRLDDIVGLVLTHGHEDHIGAVPYLLKHKPDIPLVGSQLTLALIEAKLKEHRIRNYDLRVVREGDTAEIGEEFDVVDDDLGLDPIEQCIDRLDDGTPGAEEIAEDEVRVDA